MEEWFEDDQAYIFKFLSLHMLSSTFTIRVSSQLRRMIAISFYKKNCLSFFYLCHPSIWEEICVKIWTKVNIY